MPFTENEQNELQVLVKGNPLLERLLSEWKEFYESPNYETYVMLRSQIDDWNSQLTVTGNGNTGKIDLFADKDAKEFDRVKWVLASAYDNLDLLDKIRAKLTTAQVADIEKQKRKRKHEGVVV